MVTSRVSTLTPHCRADTCTQRVCTQLQALLSGSSFWLGMLSIGVHDAVGQNEEHQYAQLPYKYCWRTLQPINNKGPARLRPRSGGKALPRPSWPGGARCSSARSFARASSAHTNQYARIPACQCTRVRHAVEDAGYKLPPSLPIRWRRRSSSAMSSSLSHFSVL